MGNKHRSTNEQKRKWLTENKRLWAGYYSVGYRKREELLEEILKEMQKAGLYSDSITSHAKVAYKKYLRNLATIIEEMI